MIKQLWDCPALMVPVAVDEPGAVCTQSSRKIGGLNPVVTDSVTVKEPRPNVTTLVCPSPRVNEVCPGSIFVGMTISHRELLIPF
jgi:hypothetical protein